MNVWRDLIDMFGRIEGVSLVLMHSRNNLDGWVAKELFQEVTYRCTHAIRVPDAFMGVRCVS